jgi:hypothetical protein
LEGSGYGLIKVLSQNLPGEIEENYKNLSQDSWCPGQAANQALP